MCYRELLTAIATVRKTDTSAAYYEVIESEADVVRMVFAIYTQQRFSINAIARLLNERGVSTRTGKLAGNDRRCGDCCATRPMKGKACFGKTEQSERQRITLGRCVSGTVPRTEATVIVIGLARTGSKCPFLRW